MNTSAEKGWFTEHRRWEDYCSAGLGVLIVLSPGLVGSGVGTAVAVSTGLAGVLITMIALLEVLSLERWEEVLELICGAWIAIAPFLLGYGGVLRVAHLVLGAAVIVLALVELWQDRHRRFANES